MKIFGIAPGKGSAGDQKRRFLRLLKDMATAEGEEERRRQRSEE